MSVVAGNVGVVTKDAAQPDESEDTETVIEGEVLPAAPGPVPEPADTGYTAAGVPTFDAVREKIETRYGTALGASELAAETPGGRSVEEQYEQRQQAAAERLQQIRESMRDRDDDA